MLLLVILVFGLFAGWVANLILGGGTRPQDWGLLLAAGIGGSFVGGLLGGLISGDGLSLKPTGLIGSIAGAVIVLAVVQAVQARKA